jgi:hypothetical protein
MIADKLKAEREKFYDALLQKVLALPSVQEYIRDLKTGETKISGVETEYEYEASALDDFFTGNPKDILAVEEIWNAVKEAVREEAEWRTSDAKTFWEDGLGFKAEDTMDKTLEEISDELDNALKRRYYEKILEAAKKHFEKVNPRDITFMAVSHWLVSLGGKYDETLTFRLRLDLWRWFKVGGYK